VLSSYREVAEENFYGFLERSRLLFMDLLTSNLQIMNRILKRYQILLADMEQLDQMDEDFFKISLQKKHYTISQVDNLIYPRRICAFAMGKDLLARTLYNGEIAVDNYLLPLSEDDYAVSVV
jgi:hypothetical protein